MVTINEHDAPALDDGPRLSRDGIRAVLKPVASLKLTVGLLAASVFLVLAGTLAQSEQDIWQVVGQYFRGWFARVDLAIFFPKAWFPSMWSAGKPPFSGYFWFPGGFTIGTLMGVNLLAAHSLRFTVQVRGIRAIAGAVVLLAGIGATWFVIASNDNTNGLQGVPGLKWQQMWTLFKSVLTAVCVGGVCGFLALDPRRVMERWLLLGLTLVLSVATAALWIRNDFVLGDSSMRILWQLLQGGLAGLALLAGCALLFRKRAGIVLLHGGIALMMANELVVALKHEEAQMRLREGETLNWVQDIRSVELAVVDPSDAAEDRVIVVPGALLEQSLKNRSRIQHPDLPVDIEVVAYYPNSELRQVGHSDRNPATHGTGLSQLAVERKAGTGVDTDATVDFPSAYLKFLPRDEKDSVGTYLVSLERSLDPEHVPAGKKTWQVSLRFKRTYKPWSITLKDVRGDMYMGTTMAKDYASDIVVNDPTRGVKDREIKIWMNNPLRFAGETFYQSQFNIERSADGLVEVTGLQVVKNDGWMIPYVACMIVAVGMLAQFLLTLSRFLNRRTPVARPQEGDGDQLPDEPVATSPWKTLEALFPAGLVTVAAMYLAAQIQIPGPSPEGFKLYEFGRIPVVYQGRVKPLDTIARNSLRLISDYESFWEHSGKKDQPAIRWLLDLMAGTGAAGQHRVIKIDSPEVVRTLKLEHRKGFLYSIDEIEPNLGELERQERETNDVSKEKRSPYQRKLLDVARRIRLLRVLEYSLKAPRVSKYPTLDEFKEDRQKAIDDTETFLRFLKQAPEELQRLEGPLAIPLNARTERGETVWKPYSLATAEAAVPPWDRNPKPRPVAVKLWDDMLAGYRASDSTKFNRAVAEYRSFLKVTKPTQVRFEKSDFESYFNNAMPFYWGTVCYVLAFVLAAGSWLGWQKPLNRGAFWLIVFTLLIHTAGLISRIYISGRPPVTNLYSSAVFISWGCVVLGLILERLFGKSLGNLVAATTGFAGLVIAHKLSLDGDTFVVLQAVLDTQFWLATHVVCISLGYSTTFLAGFLGILYVAMCVVRPAILSWIGQPADDAELATLGKELGKMIYGVLCFAIFFSFVGTVLGGLWADDSWGRFWGWDPKENGALIIVLWNALVLHAKWDRIVGDRGLALLALGGNVCTAWSWFGVNELGVGLHSYGFTDGVLFALGITAVSHLTLIALGALPKAWTHRPS